MSTLAEITALIDTELASSQAGGITAAQHRDVLGKNVNSVLKNMFVVPTTESSPTIGILTPNANFNYTCQVTKIGNLVNLSGNAQALGNGNTVLFDITNTEYQPRTSSNLGSCYKQLTETSVKIDARGDNNRVEVGTLSLGETIDFNITYIVQP